MVGRRPKNIITKTLGILLIAMTFGCQMDATEKASKKGRIEPITTACKPDSYADLIGQDSSVLTDMELPPKTRILRPGMMMPMDYFKGRLNFYLDAFGKIERISCG